MTTPDRPRAYSYIRFSSPEQAKGHSLERQRTASLKYALDHGLELDERLTYRDLGKSAYDGSNLAEGSALGRFLELVRDGDVPRGSYLLVESLDRLSRMHINDALQLFMELQKHGIIIVTLMDGWQYKTTNTPADFQNLLMVLVIFSRANEESATKADRLRSAWLKKRARASEVRLTQLCPAWMRLAEDRKAYELIPEKAAVVSQIIQMTLDGMGRASIARNLNGKNIATIAVKRNRRDTSKPDKTNPMELWHESYIAKILTNRALVGEFQAHREEAVDGKAGQRRRVPAGLPIPGYFPALLTEDEFAELQAVIKGRGLKSGGRRGTGFSNLFTGLVRCGYCERPMLYINKGEDSRKNRDSRRNKYLICSTAHHGKGCHKLPWIYHEFEDSFFAHATKTNFADFVAQSNDRKSAIRSLRDQRQIVEEKLHQNKVVQERLLDAIETATDGSFDAINQRLTQRQSQATQLNLELARLKAELERDERQSIAAARAIEALEVVRQQLGQQTEETAFRFRASVNQALKRTVNEIVLYPGGLISTEDERGRARKALIASGHPLNAVEETLALTFRTKPSSAHRLFTINNRNEAFQVLHPDEKVADFEKALDASGERRWARRALISLPVTA
jgi:DNA invertase Pin-like site-specific DNA recombinase